MSAVKAQGEVFATEARSLFNQGGFRGSTFSCPGSIVLWGPTINVRCLQLSIFPPILASLSLSLSLCLSLSLSSCVFVSFRD